MMPNRCVCDPCQRARDLEHRALALSFEDRQEIALDLSSGTDILSVYRTHIFNVDQANPDLGLLEYETIVFGLIIRSSSEREKES